MLDRARYFRKKNFAQKLGKWTKNRGFFYLKKNAVNNSH